MQIEDARRRIKFLHLKTARNAWPFIWDSSERLRPILRLRTASELIVFFSRRIISANGQLFSSSSKLMSLNFLQKVLQL